MVVLLTTMAEVRARITDMVNGTAAGTRAVGMVTGRVTTATGGEHKIAIRVNEHAIRLTNNVRKK